MDKKLKGKEQVCFEIRDDIMYRIENGDNLMFPIDCIPVLGTEIHKMYGHIRPRKWYKILQENFYARGLRH